jgi:hypothetical protein
MRSRQKGRYDDSSKGEQVPSSRDDERMVRHWREKRRMFGRLRSSYAGLVRAGS